MQSDPTLQSAAPSTRDEYRVITTFDDFDVYEYHLQKTVTRVDHRNISMTFATLEGAEKSAEGMCRLHDPAWVKANGYSPKTPTIKSQVVEHRTVSVWEVVDAVD